MRVVVTGVTGKVGGVLADSFKRQGMEVITASRAELDLSRPEEVRRTLGGWEFDALVNAAAMAGIEQCENEPDLARRVNAESPAAMARACAEKGARMIHLSTDYVLDGSVEGLKDEAAQTFPNGAYGRSKLAGEEAVTRAFPEAGIARISWVFGSAGSGGQGFLETIMARAQNLPKGDSLEGIADKFSTPTYVYDLAEWLTYLLARASCEGIWHLTHPSAQPKGESWHSYAETTVKLAHEAGLLPQAVNVIPRYQADGEIFQVLRPVHTGLAPLRLLAEPGFQMRTWQKAAKDYLLRERLIS